MLHPEARPRAEPRLATPLQHRRRSQHGAVRMAVAFKKAVEAGREAYELGLPETSNAASATSPLTGFLNA